MEPLHCFEGSLTQTVPVGLVLGDVRIDVHFGGQVMAGAFAGAPVPMMKLTVPRGAGLVPLCLKGLTR